MPQPIPTKMRPIIFMPLPQPDYAPVQRVITALIVSVRFLFATRKPLALAARRALHDQRELPLDLLLRVMRR